jgi:hypothetical protein
MHNKFHKLLVDRLVGPLDPDGREILLHTLRQIDLIVKEQYKRYVLSDGTEDEP